MLVVKIVLAAGMLTGLMVVAGRFATRWTTEDPITVAERRHARRSRRGLARDIERVRVLAAVEDAGLTVRD